MTKIDFKKMLDGMKIIKCDSGSVMYDLKKTNSDFKNFEKAYFQLLNATQLKHENYMQKYL